MVRGLDMYGLALGNINALHCYITDSTRPFFHTKKLYWYSCRWDDMTPLGSRSEIAS